MAVVLVGWSGGGAWVGGGGGAGHAGLASQHAATSPGVPRLLNSHGARTATGAGVARPPGAPHHPKHCGAQRRPDRYVDWWQGARKFRKRRGMRTAVGPHSDNTSVGRAVI